MSTTFADSLKSLRSARGLSQQQLAAKLFVDRSTVARWESGDRMPDLAIVPRIAECLGVDTAALISAVQGSEAPEVIVVDDERIALAGAISVLEKALPGTAITGFTKPSDALAFTQAHAVGIAFLDIEIGRTNGLDLCRALIEQHHRHRARARKRRIRGRCKRSLHRGQLKRATAPPLPPPLSRFRGARM